MFMKLIPERYVEEKVENMVILHIANIGDNLYSGVRVVVPQHINAQSKYADVAFIIYATLTFLKLTTSLL